MKAKSLKIAVFHLGFFYSGGGEKLVLEEIKGLRKLGHKVTCYAPYVDRERCFPDVAEMSEIQSLLPSPPQWLPLKAPLWVALSCLLIPFMAWRFRQFDVFLGANQPGPWFAFVLSKVLRKPYVVYLAQALRILHPRPIDLEKGIRIREGDYKFLVAMEKTVGFIIDWADRTSLKHAQFIMTNGHHVSRWISEVYRVRNYALPAGCYVVPEEELDYSNKWSGQTRLNGLIIRKPFILLTNRHAPAKRFEYAIWAMKALRRDLIGITLVITGQPTEYTDQLEYLVEGLGLRDVVQFVGLVREEDLTTLYKEAALYVYPSPEEDFGMGIVEAMAAGIPAVAWRSGGPTVTVRDRVTGFLVEPYDTEMFTERMLQLATSPVMVEGMGRAAHSRAKELFSYERHNKILEQALIEATNAHQRVPDLKRESEPLPARAREEFPTLPRK